MNCGNRLGERIVSTSPVPGSVGGGLLTTNRPAWLLRSLSANSFRATHLSHTKFVFKIIISIILFRLLISLPVNSSVRRLDVVNVEDPAGFQTDESNLRLYLFLVEESGTVDEFWIVGSVVNLVIIASRLIGADGGDKCSILFPRDFRFRHRFNFTGESHGIARFDGRVMRPRRELSR